MQRNPNTTPTKLHIYSL